MNIIKFNDLLEKGTVIRPNNLIEVYKKGKYVYFYINHTTERYLKSFGMVEALKIYRKILKM